jgi:hypothetical protein
MPNYNVGPNLVEGQSISPIEGVSTAVTGIIGNFLKGPLGVETMATSFAQFTSIFGDKPPGASTSWYSVKAFFAAVGTGNLRIVRVASSTAAKGTKTIQDRQGAPANTIKIDAKNEGAWGNNISVEIATDHLLTTTLASDTTATPTQAILTSVGGLEVGSAAATVESMEFKITVYFNGVEVESHPNLSMNDEVTFFCEKQVVSNYITVTDLKAVDTDYQDLPAVTTPPEALASGADGLSDVTGSDYEGVQASKSGVYAFDNVPDLFRFCCPNPLLTDVDPAAAYQSLVQSLLDYANNRVTVDYWMDVPFGKTITEAKTFGELFEGMRLDY